MFIDQFIDRRIDQVEVTSVTIRDLLMALPPEERNFVVSDAPNVESRKIVTIRRNSDGNFEYEYIT